MFAAVFRRGWQRCRSRCRSSEDKAGAERPRADLETPRRLLGARREELSLRSLVSAPVPELDDAVGLAAVCIGRSALGCGRAGMPPQIRATWFFADPEK